MEVRAEGRGQQVPGLHSLHGLGQQPGFYWWVNRGDKPRPRLTPFPAHVSTEQPMQRAEKLDPAPDPGPCPTRPARPWGDSPRLPLLQGHGACGVGGKVEIGTSSPNQEWAPPPALQVQGRAALPILKGAKARLGVKSHRKQRCRPGCVGSL